jgi:hypothetical protein
MVNPISSSQVSHTAEAAKPPAPKPQPKPNTPLPSDPVTLKSTRDVDHDGDSH